MAEAAEATVPIGDELRFVFFGLECALGIPLSPVESERVFRDVRADQVSAKAYQFHESRGLRVFGRVEEYEPEEITLRVEGRRGAAELLRQVVAGTANHVIRLRRAAEIIAKQSDLPPAG